MQFKLKTLTMSHATISVKLNRKLNKRLDKINNRKI